MSDTPRTDNAVLDEHDPAAAVGHLCRQLERELAAMTRERDEARAKVQWFIDEWDAAQVAANFEPIPFDRSAVLVTIEDVKKREASNWQDRVKRLEKAGDAMAHNHNPFTFTDWELAKEAKP